MRPVADVVAALSLLSSHQLLPPCWAPTEAEDAFSMRTIVASVIPWAVLLILGVMRILVRRFLLPCWARRVSPRVARLGGSIKSTITRRSKKQVEPMSDDPPLEATQQVDPVGQKGKAGGAL
jgi:hypothetical protein